MTFDFAPGNAQDQGARPDQQDAFGFSDPQKKEFVVHGGMAAVVADGMGGTVNGSAASHAAVNSFLAAYQAKDPRESIPEALRRAVFAANEAVVALAAKGGTTLSAAVLCDGALHWVSVGDSRVYLSRAGRLQQLTQDHNYAQDLEKEVSMGRMTREQAATHPEREHLTSYLGLADLPKIGLSSAPEPLEPGDCAIVCSDGLYRALSEGEMAEGIQTDSLKTCDTLLKKALNKRDPKQDNITVLALKYQKEEPRVAPVRRPALLAAALAAMVVVMAGILWFLRPGIASFTASPTSSAPGDAVMLQWNVQRGSVKIEPGEGLQAQQGFREVHPTSTREYTLTASALGGLLRTSRTVSVQVTPTPAAPVVSFSVEPLKIKPPESAMLSWSVTSANEVRIEPGIGKQPPSGKAEVKPTTRTRYVLTATGSGGSKRAEVTVGVESANKPSPPSISKFFADSPTVKAGSATVLHWVVSKDATKIEVAPNVGTYKQTTEGQAQVTPAATTVYKLTAINAAGPTTETVTVEVVKAAPPAIKSFRATPAEVAPGQPATLIWQIAGDITGVSIEPGVGAVESFQVGDKDVYPNAPTTYILTAKGPGGPVTAIVKVGVKQPVAAPKILTFEAVPPKIRPGESATLRWSLSGQPAKVQVDDATISSGNELPVKPGDTKAYVLKVSGADDRNDTKTATVTVTPWVTPAIATFTADVPNISAGQSTTLHWTFNGDPATASLAPGIGSVDPKTGSRAVSPAATTEYTLTATGHDGATVNAKLKVTVSDAPVRVTKFKASPAKVKAGDPVVLEWTIEGSASKAVIDQGVGQVSEKGGKTTVKPQSTTTYQLTVSSTHGDQTKTATVNIIPPPVIERFEGDPLKVGPGKTVKLTWKVSNANSVKINAFPEATSGACADKPQFTTKYTLLADGAGGQASKDVNVEVDPSSQAEAKRAPPPCFKSPPKQ